MQPRDQLFATLDVTMHAGRLPNSVVVLYADTIGFISDIPTDLIESFSAVLEDVNNAVQFQCCWQVVVVMYSIICWIYVSSYYFVINS